MKRSKHSGTILARDVLKTARLSLQSVHKSQNLMRPTDAHSVQPIAAQSWQLIMHAVVVGVQLQCSEPVLRWRCHRIMVRRMLWHTHTHTHTHTHMHALPQHVRNVPSLSVFRRELKTVLFRSSFPDAIWQCTVLYLCACRSVLICHHVLAATNWFFWHCMVVLQQQCDNAT